MSIPMPNLDDRDFPGLVADAVTRIQQVDPEWTDLSVHDPGIVLVEAFAHLTDILLYRLNRVPERLYVAFLNLLGTSLGAPGAARATLTFSRPAPGPSVRIPRGTRVSTVPGLPGTPVPVFVTLADAVLAPDATEIDVQAADVALHEAVQLGVGTGAPGQSFVLPGAPLVDGPEVTVGVQTPASSPLASGQGLLVDGLAFRIGREVGVFADAEPGELVYRLDRSAGVVSFPWFDPADTVRPAVPLPGMQVRAWYRTGGGERGNVGRGQLTVLRDAVGGLKVTNRDVATGGRDTEPLAGALLRGPQEFQARDRVVTARDYELVASRHGGVERARAQTRRDIWSFAQPGQVEVVLVPHVPQAQRPGGRVSRDILEANARDDVRAEVEQLLRSRATIGAEPIVEWAHYKQVSVDARIVVRPDEDPDAVRTRILARLAAAITPLADSPTPSDLGSDFGRPLRVSNLYGALEEAEPGVRFVERVQLLLDEVPDAEAVALVRAPGQPGTWFTAQGGTVFRTTNAGDGWEAVGHFGGEAVRAIVPWPVTPPGRTPTLARPGLVAVATGDHQSARIHVSDDLGGTWRQVAELGFGVAGLAWVDRGGTPTLLLAGTRGLYELPLAEGSIPVQNLVDPHQPDRGFQAIVTFTDVRGRTGVLLAAEAAGGLWLSPSGGSPDSFRMVRAAGEEIRTLTTSYDGPTVFLWAGRSALEGDGTGCVRLAVDELGRVDAATLAAMWEELRTGWTGGSCRGLAVLGDRCYAATQSAGVLALQLGAAAPTWVAPDVNCGLPLRDRRRFTPVSSVSGATVEGADLLLAAGSGVHRSRDRGATWQSCADRVVDDVVTIPSSWLFCSGEHRVEVVAAHG